MESPSGVECLHRIVIAAAIVLPLRAPEGLRQVSEFLELSGLAQFAASSFARV